MGILLAIFVIGIASTSGLQRKRQLMIFLWGSFDTNFLPTNTTFDSTFNFHPSEHSIFEGFANSKFLSIGELQTPEAPQNRSDPGHPLQNFSQKFDHSSWTINDILPGDFDGHPLASRVDRNVESHTFQPRNYYRLVRPKALHTPRIC